MVSTFGGEPVLSRWLVAFGGVLARFVGIAFPALALADSGSYAVAFALGTMVPAMAAVGRAQYTTNAHLVHASRDGLEVVAPDQSTTRIPWADVTAIECWRSMAWRTDLSIHADSKDGIQLVRVWANESADTLRNFLTCCAEHVSFAEGRIGPLASLRDSSVREPLRRRFVADTALSAAVLALAGIYARMPWLGVVLLAAIVAMASSASALLVVTSMRLRRRPTTFELSREGWVERSAASKRIHVELPGALRSWGEALRRCHPSVEEVPYRSAS